MDEKKHKAKKKNTFDVETSIKAAVNLMFTQMQATLGFKLFGYRAVAAMINEFKRLEEVLMPGKKAVTAINPETLSAEEKEKLLNAVNIIKQKRDGTIRCRTCADGSKQKRYLGKYESVASPTVSLESLFTTLVIDSYEERDIATFGIPGAYLHAKIPADKNVILKLRGHFVDIMCEINEEYRQYIRYEQGKKFLYFKVLRAIYGCIESALQWYNLYTQTLKAEGYILN